MPEIPKQPPIRNPERSPSRFHPLTTLKRLVRYLGRLVRVNKTKKRYMATDESHIQKLSKGDDPEWTLGEGAFAKAIMVTRGNRYFVAKQTKEDSYSNIEHEFSLARKRITGLKKAKGDNPDHLARLEDKIKAKKSDLEPLSPKLSAFFSKIDAYLEIFRSSDAVSLDDVDALRKVTEDAKELKEYELGLNSLCWSVQFWLNDHQEEFSTSWESIEKAETAIEDHWQKITGLIDNETAMATEIAAIKSSVLVGGEMSAEGMLSPLAGEPIEKLLTKSGEKPQKPLPAHLTQEILSQIASGLSDLHANELNHMDLNFGNILVDGAGRVKIIDFGLCCSDDQLFSAPRETPLSKAETIPLRISPSIILSPPERFTATGERPGSADMWAFGLHLTSLLTGNALQLADASNLFRQARSGSELSQIIQQQVGGHCIRLVSEAYGEASPEADLAKRLFEPDPEKRITSEEVLKHPYFLMDFKNDATDPAFLLLKNRSIGPDG